MSPEPSKGAVLGSQQVRISPRQRQCCCLTKLLHQGGAKPLSTALTPFKRPSVTSTVRKVDRYSATFSNYIIYINLYHIHPDTIVETLLKLGYHQLLLRGFFLILAGMVHPCAGRARRHLSHHLRPQRPCNRCKSSRCG